MRSRIRLLSPIHTSPLITIVSLPAVQGDGQMMRRPPFERSRARRFLQQNVSTASRQAATDGLHSGRCFHIPPQVSVHNPGGRRSSVRETNPASPSPQMLSDSGVGKAYIISVFLSHLFPRRDCGEPEIETIFTPCCFQWSME